MDAAAHWNDDASRPLRQRGAYVAVSGNTGAGKSTLVKAIRERIERGGALAVAVDERLLHHPLLRLMFADPRRYSLPVQLNFLLQRYLMISRWLSIGYSVVIERSHLDDELFIRHHYDCGHVTREEFDTYRRLAHVLNSRLPDPDVYIYLDVTPDVSMRRLAESETSGERPREFPNDAVKQSFVRAWHDKYAELFTALEARKRSGDGLRNTALLRFDTGAQPDELADTVIAYLARAGVLVRAGAEPAR